MPRGLNCEFDIKCINFFLFFINFVFITHQSKQSLNKEDKEVDAYVEGYIAFMRQCK